MGFLACSSWLLANQEQSAWNTTGYPCREKGRPLDRRQPQSELQLWAHASLHSADAEHGMQSVKTVQLPYLIAVTGNTCSVNCDKPFDRSRGGGSQGETGANLTPCSSDIMVGGLGIDLFIHLLSVLHSCPITSKDGQHTTCTWV